MALGLGGLVTGRPDAGVDIDLAVPGRPIGPWSRRTGAPEASATGRDRTTTGPRWSPGPDPRVFSGHERSRRVG
jgi:hypothetical protein